MKKQMKKKKGSIGVRLIIIFLVMIVMSSITNTLNYSALRTMNVAINDIAVDKLGNMTRVNNVQNTLEAVQKDFYRYLATGIKEGSHAEAGEDYTADLEKLSGYFAELIDAAETEDEKAELQAIYETGIEIVNDMTMTMEFKDNGESGKVLVNINIIRAEMADLNESMNALKEKSNTETAEAQEFTAGLYQQISGVCTVMMLLTLASGILGMVFAIVGVAKPMKDASKKLGEIIEDVQDGKGDLTTHIECKRNDEIGQMVLGMNKFMDVLKEIIDKIKSGSFELEESANMVNEGVRAASNKITDTSATMEELAASMQEASSTVTDISGNIEQIKEEIDVMAEKTNEGLVHVDNIRKKADDMKADATNSQKSVNGMVNQISGELSTAIEQSRQVDKINELTDEILSISSQTNLLALNASIEAARAGEAGKGFAVVADEIRKLADDSRNTANGIQDISKLVTESVSNLAENAEKMLHFVNEEVLKDYDGMVETGENYHEDAGRMNEMMRELQAVAEKLKDAAEKIADAANGVADAVNQSAEGVGNVAEYTSDLAGHMTEINSSVEKNLTIADSLKSEVKDFRCE